MQAIKFLLVLLTAVSFNAAALSSKTFSTAEEFIASQGGGAKNATIARGDLTGDGKDDVAIVLLFDRADDDSDRMEQLFVLTRTQDDRLTLAESSKKTEIAGMGCCWVEALDIKNGSVYIQNNAKTACDMEAATHQFKLYRGVWRLVGLHILNYQHCDDPQVSDTQDVNILTGKIIHSRQLDERPAKSWVTRFHPAVALLKDYDFFNGFGLPE